MHDKGNEDFIALGEKILNNHILSEQNSFSDSFYSKSFSENTDTNEYDQIYAKSLVISQFFMKNNIDKYNQKISFELQEEILNQSRELVKMLEKQNKIPKPSIGIENSIFEALNILSFSLLLLQHNNEISNLFNEKYQNDESLKMQQKENEIEKMKLEIQALTSILADYENIIKLIKNKLKVPNDIRLKELYYILNNEFDKHTEENPFLNGYIIKKPGYNQANISSMSKFLYDLDNLNPVDTIQNFITEKLGIDRNSNQEEVKEKISNLLEEYNFFKTSFNLKYTQSPPENQNDLISLENESLKKTIDSLSQENSKLRERETTLRKITNDLSATINEKTTEIGDLTLKLNQVSVEKDELESGIERLKAHIDLNPQPIKNNEFNEQAFNFLLAQIENQSDELSKMSEDRNTLINVIHAQSGIIEFFNDTQITSLLKGNHLKYDDKKNQIQDDSKIIEMKEKDFFDGLKNKLLENTNTEIFNFHEILDSNRLNNEEKIISIISNLLSQITVEKSNCSKLQNSYLEVSRYLSSLLTFIDKLSNSDETIDFLTSSNKGPNPFLLQIKDTIFGEVQRLSLFLKERQIDDIGPDFLQIPHSLNKISSNDTQTISLGDTRLQVVLTVDEILRKYSIFLENKANLLSSDLQKFQEEMIHYQIEADDIKAQLENEKQKHAETISKSIQFEEDNSNEYISKYNLLKKENLSLKKEVNDIILSYKKAKKLLRVMKTKCEQKDLDQTNKIDQLSSQVSSIQTNYEEIVSLKNKCESENNELKEIVKQLTKRINQFEVEKKDAVEAKIEELSSHFEETITNLKNKKKSLKEKIKEQKELILKSKKTMNDTKEQQINSLSEKNRNLTKKIENMSANYECIISNLRQRLLDFQNRESELKNSIEDISNNSKEIANKLKESKIELKLKTVRIKNLEDKIEQQRVIHQNQFETLKINYESDFNEKINAIEIKNQNEKYNFLVKIFELLNDYVDFRQQINEDSCIHLIQTLAEKVNESSSLYQKATEDNTLEAKNYFDELRTLLNSHSNSEAFSAIIQMINSSKSPNSDDFKNNSQDEHREDIISELKKWQNWAQRLQSVASDYYYTFDLNDLNKNDEVLRETIEEKIMNSIGNRLIFRRIEILRKEKAILLKSQHGSKSILSKRYEVRPNSESHYKQSNLYLINVIAVVIASKRIIKISGKLPAFSLGVDGHRKIFSLNISNQSSEDTKKQKPCKNSIIPIYK